MKTLSLLLSSLLFVACGGGGSSTSTSATSTTAAVSNVSTESFQVRQAFVKDFNNTASLPFTFGGTVSAIALSGTGLITQSAVSAVTFNGLAALLKSRSTGGNLVQTTATSATTTAITPLAENFYIDSAGSIVGFVSSGVYAVALAPVNLPVTAKVGDKGEMGKLTTYATSAKIISTGTIEYSYALDVDTSSSAILTISQNQKTAAGVSQGIQANSYKLVSTAVLPLKIVSTVSSGSSPSTLSFTF